MSEREKIKGRCVPSEAKVVGMNLRDLREEAGLSRRALGDVLGVSQQQVQKYEAGLNRFPLEKLHVLKCFYDVPYERFLKGLEEEVRFERAAPVLGKDPLAYGVYLELSKLNDKFLKQKICKAVRVLAA